jgi:hypothetical protein
MDMCVRPEFNAAVSKKVHVVALRATAVHLWGTFFLFFPVFSGVFYFYSPSIRLVYCITVRLTVTEGSVRYGRNNLLLLCPCTAACARPFLPTAPFPVFRVLTVRARLVRKKYVSFLWPLPAGDTRREIKKRNRLARNTFLPRARWLLNVIHAVGRRGLPSRAVTPDRGFVHFVGTVVAWANVCVRKLKKNK